MDKNCLSKLLNKSQFVYPQKSKIEDLDIISIHQAIIDRFDELNDEIPTLKKYLKQLNYTFRTAKTAKERFDTKQKFDYIKKIIQITKNNNGKRYYLNWTKPLINKYKKNTQNTIIIDFSNCKNNCVYSDENKNIIKEYLLIARNYIDIEIVQQLSNYIPCVNCSTSSANNIMYCIDENVYVCSICGFTQIIILPSSNFKDTVRLNSKGNNKYYYQKETNLRDAIKQYQGKQNKTIPADVYAFVYTWMEKNKINKKDLTKDHLKLLFSSYHDQGYSLYYDDITLIHHQITGISLPDISHIENNIIDRFRKIVPVFYRIRPNNRGSFLNIQYVFYQLLRLEKWKCSIDDFSILEDPERRRCIIICGNNLLKY